MAQSSTQPLAFHSHKWDLWWTKRH